jgi:hypothetical protein
MSIIISGTTGIDAGSLPVANTGKISAGSGLPVILNTAGVDRVTVDTAGNVGIGTTPSTWSTTGNVELMDSRVITMRGNINISSNGYYNFGWKAINTGEVTNLYTNNGGWVWQSAPSTTAGSTPSFSTKMNLDLSGNLLLTSGTGALGYGTGAGGTVTQLTSKSTAVTLNKPCGQITMNNAALAAGASVEFYLNNSLLTSTDTLVVSGGIYSYNYTTQVKTVSSSIATIRVTNVTGGTLSEALGISFTVTKGALS